jgi:hypothetical protein
MWQTFRWIGRCWNGGAEVAETTVERLLYCWFRRTGEAIGLECQCWWRICFFLRFEYHMFYVLYPFVAYLLISLGSTWQHLGTHQKVSRMSCWTACMFLYRSYLGEEGRGLSWWNDLHGHNIAVRVSVRCCQWSSIQAVDRHGRRILRFTDCNAVRFRESLASCASASFLLGSPFDSKDSGDVFLQNVGLSASYTAA